MFNRIVVLLLLLPYFCLCQTPNAPADEESFSGYITRVDGPKDFDVNGYRIVFRSNTKRCLEIDKDHSSCPHEETASLKPYPGAKILVYGSRSSKKHTIEAAQIIFRSADPARSGFGLIQQVTALDKTSYLLEADGYQIRITDATKKNFTTPLTSASPIQTNTWIAYEGQQQPDGTIISSKAAFILNQISPSEQKLRDHTEYDTEAVSPDAHQSSAAKVFFGLDPQKVPPYHDEALEKRIDDIGQKLIPGFQRELPDSDPTKIKFRFQLVDEPSWSDAISLSSGIILVPYQAAQRLQNDSQLATMLADNIGEVIEKQAYRIKQLNTKLQAVNLTGTALGMVIPFTGLAVQAGTTTKGVSALRHDQEQSARISLCLLHRAGYDINEAPKTWQITYTKNGKPVEQTFFPQRSLYLYDALGTIWHTDAVAASPNNLQSETH